MMMMMKYVLQGKIMYGIPVILSLVNYLLDDKHHEEMKHENSQQGTTKLYAVIFHFSIHVSV
jgi:hypothetical protein